MLTARDRLDDRIRGFEVGADDYLVKPFSLRELLARLQAITRRAAPEQVKKRLTVDDVLLDQAAREVYRGGRLVHLTPKEFSVLELLMAHAGMVVSREAIVQSVWGYDSGGDSNVLETCVKGIRRVIDSGRAVPLVQTVRGAGYKVKPPGRSTSTS
jgi:two-component system response regulator MprA